MIRAAAALVLVLLAAGTARAEPLTDTPHCQLGLFCLSAERQGDSILLQLESKAGGPFTLAVETRTEALDGPASPLRLTFEAGESHELARYRILTPGVWSLDWTYSFHLGTRPARHDPDAVYRLPYAPGEDYEVIQAGEGGFSHRGPLRHAVDWAMPSGTEIRAARAGLVVGLRDGAGPGGLDPEERGRENYLWIRHDDGTLGQYLHLQQHSVEVAQGQRVEAGQVIARAGSSGYSSEPHLHFHVSTPTRDGPYAFETFPLRFALEDGSVAELQTGLRYQAP